MRCLTSYPATTAYGSVIQWKSSRKGSSSAHSSIGGIGRRWILSGRKRFWKICGGAETRLGKNGSRKAIITDVEIARNDGYLLKEFVARKIPALGIEPAVNVAQVAQEAGIPTINRFFGSALARELVEQGHSADLIIANNVLAHVPELNDFVGGF